MAGNVRFESSPANTDELAFSGTHQNVQRGNHSGASLDRSGSFREGSEGRMFSPSASGLSRGSSPLFGEIPPISQYLPLEPFPMVDQKYLKSSDLRKVLGAPLGNTVEDGMLGSNQTKLPQPGVTEELKRFKLSLLEGSIKARTRVRKLDDSLHKLNKYGEALTFRRQQRSDMNERSGGPNMRTGSQLHRNSSDLSNHKLEERNKNPLNKRSRSSVSELRGESPPVRQSFVSGKDRELSRDSGEGSDPLEEKIRRLPAGGEGWDKKMKRKRSIGTVFSRPVEGDGEAKRPTQKLKSDPGLQSPDGQSLRSGSLNGAGGMIKSDSSLPSGSNSRGFLKNEQEKASLQRDFLPASVKDRALAKGNNKVSSREDISLQNPTPVTKGKASRAPRSGPVVTTSSPTSLPRASGGLESWEQPPNVSKVHLMGGPNNNRKRALPPGSSSSPPMTQWVGQRPQKISRTRRTNVISPVLNNDEILNSSEGCALDLGPKTTSMSRGFASGIQQLKVKLDNVSSPARLSESEESGAGESHEGRLKEKRTGSIEVDERDIPVQNVGSSGGPMKKSKLTSKDEIGDVVQREGRSGRGPLFARASSSPLREKLENAASSKPHRSMRAGSDKSGSKSGRPPLKKVSERKAFTRPGKSPVGRSPDFSGESDDDREELLMAASFASSASYSACTANFWKKMEPLYVPMCSEDISYLEKQIKSSSEAHNRMKKLNSRNSLKGNHENEENPIFQTHLYGSGDDERRCQNSTEEIDGEISLVEDDIININGRLDPGGMKVIPITQRLLASLIVEDEAMLVGDCEGRNTSFQHGDSQISCLPINGNFSDDDYSTEYDYQLFSVPQAASPFGAEKTICNGVRSKQIHSQVNCDTILGGYGQLMNNERVFAEISDNGYTSDENYSRMSVESKALLELHSIGLYPENVPDLADGEDDPINHEISDLNKKLTQKIDTKRALISRLIKAAEKAGQTSRRDLEQIAMDKHIEAAYKKLLATRANYATKYGIPKVSKHVAVAFTKRALARCRKFEETGKSCFGESPFIEALNTPPPRWEDSLDFAKIPEANPNSKVEDGMTGPLSRVDRHDPNHGHSPFETNGTFAKAGPLQNRGKKKEVLLDDIGGKPPLRTGLGNAFLGGAKGKRSDRDRDSQSKNAKSGRQINAKGERKTKAKPKQRTAQLSTSVNGFVNNNSSDVKREPVGAMSNNGNVGSDTVKEKKESVDFPNLDLPIDSIDDLDVPGWLNFDGDGLQDFDSAGLEIPMDDLSDVFL